MSFGELALQSDNPRAATVTCMENCTFAILNKNDYKRIIKLNEKRALNEKIKFIENLDCLKHLPEDKLDKIIPSFTLIYFARNAPVFKKGDPVEWVYLIRNGEF